METEQGEEKGLPDRSDAKLIESVISEVVVKQEHQNIKSANTFSLGSAILMALE